jgi:hypothetical protein
MTAEKLSILQRSENLKEFQAATCELTGAVVLSDSETAQQWLVVARTGISGRKS